MAGSARRPADLGIEPGEAAQPAGGDPRRPIAWCVASGALGLDEALALVERRRRMAS